MGWCPECRKKIRECPENPSLWKRTGNCSLGSPVPCASPCLLRKDVGHADLSDLAGLRRAEASEPHTAARPHMGSAGLWRLSTAEVVPERANSTRRAELRAGVGNRRSAAAAQPQASSFSASAFSFYAAHWPGSNSRFSISFRHSEFSNN